MEKYKDIEKSIIKKFRKEIWSKFVKGVSDYELIKENDNIMVCISGGKDSFLLAKCMQELQRHGKFKFNARFVDGFFTTDGNSILIDGSQAEVEYKPMCGKCYIKNKYGR